MATTSCEYVSADTDDFEYRMGTYEINFEEARINGILQKHHVSWEQLTDEEMVLVYLCTMLKPLNQ